VGISEDPGSSVAAPTTPHSPMGVPLDHIGVGLNVMEMLRSMSNNETLKESLECSTQWVQLCIEKGEQSNAFSNDGFFYEDFGRIVELELGRIREVIH
jgi:hypothetical protein